MTAATETELSNDTAAAAVAAKYVTIRKYGELLISAFRDYKYTFNERRNSARRAKQMDSLAQNPQHSAALGSVQV